MLKAVRNSCDVIRTRVMHINTTSQARLDTIHSGGIFAMHEQNNEIVCCSKDGTVSLTALGEGKLSPVTTYDGISSSVLKSVRWQNNRLTTNGLFGCTGNDGTVVVLDRRLGKEVATIDAHEKVSNSVAWSPTNMNEYDTPHPPPLSLSPPPFFLVNCFGYL